LTKDDQKTANASNSTTLARTWADAPPLAKFVEERAEQLCREATQSRKARQVRKLSTAEQLTIYMQYQSNMLDARRRAQSDTINDLVLGRIVGLGRSSGSYTIEAIDPLFWIGAEVDGNGAIRDDKKIIDIRIAKPNVIPSLQTRLQPGLGRPSKAEVIRAAIAEYAKTDPGLDRTRSDRFRYYIGFITSHGFNPRKDKGFGIKTFEKYEGEHRKKFRQLAPIKPL
jgi:hypothetical protein